MTARWSLRRTVGLSVLASARTEAEHHEDLGCSIQGPVARRLRAAHAPLREALSTRSFAEALREAPELLRQLEQSPAYASLCGPGRRRQGRRRLREDVLFPDVARSRPTVLHLREGSLGLDVPVRAREWPQVGGLLGALANGLEPADMAEFARVPVLRGLLAALVEAGWVERASAKVRTPNPGALFVGHNTVVVKAGGASVWVDPYFRPAGSEDAARYQPLQPRDLAPPDAVLITHSHGDHFHLGSLVQLPRTTRFLVPATERESVFSTDCARRLRQLGFERVEPLRWGEQRQVGKLSIEALPFYGEQPTDGPGLYAGLFNQGNTWSVRGPGFSAVFLADAGRDVRGDMADVCRELGRRAPVDALFCGIRGFRLRPLFYGATTLEPFLVNVPLSELTVPQQLMATAEDALRYGKLLRARVVVPCADGGAPWYWREGMGPKYRGYPGAPVPGASTRHENPDADPYPERLLEAWRQRPDSPRPCILRPGEGLRWSPMGVPRVKRFRGFTWPFGAPGEPAPPVSRAARGKRARGR